MIFYRPVSSEMRSYLSAKKKGDVRMKYLVTFNYNPTDIPELAKKAKEYDEDKKKNLSKYLDAKEWQSWRGAPSYRWRTSLHAS
jgi:hypothetical protein